MQNLDDLNFEGKEDEEQASTSNIQNEHISGEYEYADRIFLSQHTHHKTNFYKEYSGLCNDLKQLYVCITRPKKRLIIYDEDPSRRDIALRYWQKLQAVDVITEEIIEQSQHQEDSSLIDTTTSSSLSSEQKALLAKLREGTKQAQEDIKVDPEVVE